MSSEIAMFTAAAYFTTQNLDDAYLALMSIAKHFLDFPLQWPAKSVMRLAFNLPYVVVVRCQDFRYAYEGSLLPPLGTYWRSFSIINFHQDNNKYLRPRKLC